ncbi:PBP1A family penicillin-binding protein [Cytophagaceae bacterium ABcell3]|nr:PBP1A family penicillin-binding protein [Cytophagaceae bacterium ABcell3]
MNRKQNQTFKQQVQRFALKLIGAGVLLLVFVFTLFYLAVRVGVFGSLPSVQDLKAVDNYTASEIFSSDGKLLGKYYFQDRSNVKFEDLSPSLVNALVATEDARFYEHSGVDYTSMFRVLIKSLLLGNESSGGGSTISQQLAKNLFPRATHGRLSMPVNKMREIIIASRLEKAYSKNEILTLYLNTVPFGENAWGIGSASRRFFNKTPGTLNTEEAAVLVGMLKATSYYNPKKYPERAVQRRNVVLSQMAKYDFINEEQAEELKNTDLQLHYVTLTHNDGLATYFREFLRQEVQKNLKDVKRPEGGKYNVYTDGLKIYTTIDSRMQQYAEEAMKEHMSQLQLLFYKHWGNKQPWGRNHDVIIKAVERSDRYRALKKRGMDDAEIRKTFAEPQHMKVFSWNGEVEKEMTPLDSVKYYQHFLHAAFMAMDPTNGEIKAWVGGLNHRHFKYDHVNPNAKRQVGSTFKPLVYATALEKGISPCEYIANKRIMFTNYDNWSPRNSDSDYGGYYSLTGGLNKSVNTISAHLIAKTGIPAVVDLAKEVGITSNLEPVPSMALGSADISLYEMVGAYGTFANQGRYTEPVYLLKIEDKNGNIIFENKDRVTKQVISAENADILTHMLQGVVNNGTAARLRYQFNLRNDIAGKTGTTQSHADGWFMGYTPSIVAGVWVGAEDRRVHFRTIDLGQGANMALPIWGKFMQKVNNDPGLRSMAMARFPRLSDDARDKVDCEPYVDQLPKEGRFWDLFKAKKENKKKDYNRASATHKPRHNYRSQPKKEEKKNTVDKIKNLFKKK